MRPSAPGLLNAPPPLALVRPVGQPHSGGNRGHKGQRAGILNPGAFRVFFAKFSADLRCESRGLSPRWEGLKQTNKQTQKNDEQK